MVALLIGGKMNFDEVMTTLEKAGTAQNRKVCPAWRPTAYVWSDFCGVLAKKNKNVTSWPLNCGIRHFVSCLPGG
jgi:hypothetical protein